MRKTITIPQAGKIERFSFDGKTAIIENVGTFSGVNQVPLLGFNGHGAEFPMYPLATLPNIWDGDIKQISIEGTAESAGSQVTILTLDACLSLDFKPQFSGSYKSYPGSSITKQMDDSVQQFSELELMDENDNLPKEVHLVRLGAGEINYRWNEGGGVDPSQGGNDSKLPTNPDLLKVTGVSVILGMKFTNDVAGETPILLAHPIY